MKKCKVRKRLMGSDFELIACGEDEGTLLMRLEEGVAEIQRLEQLLTEFNDASETSKINAGAGLHAVKTLPEVIALIQRCLQLSTLTQGAFDITSGALKKLYSFKEKKIPWPAPAAIAETLSATGYKHISITGHDEIFLARKGMRIGFGAIGKGYAADCVKRLWMNAGITSGVVNASGDLCAWGLQPDGTPWKVGIADPDRPDNIIMWLPVENAAVATSGNYEQYIERDGIRYSHNIDPVTGMPVRFLKSVTIISPSAELSDALATAVTIMGADVGLDFVNQLPHIHCVIITEENKVLTSSKIKTYAPEPTPI
jgi:thiamine biosynthesis lipoprotein